MGMWEQYDKSLRELIDLAKKEERKKICDEIRRTLNLLYPLNTTSGVFIDKHKVLDILDQIEKRRIKSNESKR